MQKVASEHLPDPHFISEYRRNVTLEPLRSFGVDSLNFQGIVTIRKITLRELEIHWNNALHEVTIRKSDNLFDGARGGPVRPDPIPSAGTLASASFDLQLLGKDKPTTLHIRPPYLIKLEPPCDIQLILPWLDKQGFSLLQTLVKTVSIIALAWMSAYSPILDIEDDDNGEEHHWSMVGGR